MLARGPVSRRRVRRLLLVLPLLLVLGTGLYFYVRYTITAAYESAAEQLRLEQENRLIWGETVLQPLAGRLERSIDFLTRVPPILGITRARDNGGIDPEFNLPEAVWVERLATIMLFYVKAQPDVFQARLIDAETGLERVRAQRLPDGSLHQASAAELQHKGERRYVQAGRRLKPGQVMFSELELNRELGRIEMPQRPTLRAVTPVAGADGAVWGVLVVNLEVSEYLRHLADLGSATLQIRLVNAEGNYLLHPEVGRAFEHELGTDAMGWQQEFTVGADAPGAWALPGSLRWAAPRTPHEEGLLFSQLPINFDVGAGGPQLALRVATPLSVFEHLAWRLAAERLFPIALAVASLLVALAIGLLLLQSRARNRLLRSREDELRQATARLHELAHTDGLTGIANRREFDRVLKREWARAQRNRSPISLVLIDLDHFKEVNDQLGHAEGDAVLQSLAQLLQPELKRPVDLLARYGGEEFVVLLPDTGLEGAVQLAERLREVVEAGFAGNVGDGDENIVVTASLGCASTVPAASEDSEQLARTADEQLYAAKSAGRNRVMATSV